MRNNLEGHRPPSAETEGGAEWTLEKVASVGDLPKDPTNADLVEYGIRNGLLRQGEGIKQLVAKAEQFDPESANILKAVVDANQRDKKGKGLAFTGTMKPEVFTNNPRRPERNPRKFERYAQESINDMMGAWVMTRGDKETPMRDNSPTYRAIRSTLNSGNKDEAEKLLSTLGDSGIRRTLVRDTTNKFASLENRRNTVYYIEHFLTGGGPLQQLKELLKENPSEDVGKVADDSRDKIGDILE